MNTAVTKNVDTELIFRNFIDGVKHRNPHEPEFHQAVSLISKDLIPFIEQNPKYRNMMLLERLSEPDRIITFRVSWQDDQGNIHSNRGYRVQTSNAIGPYKGGIRFHPSVNQSILKFLAFEQTFKNSLTGLPMGGGKGGSDFDPKGKSDSEVMRFCQSFMIELSRHIGPDTDVPAGDIGVGAREIGYMNGQLKRLTNAFTGTLTGKGIEYGGSLFRTEATGYGLLFFLEEALKTNKDQLDGKTILISGSGNVAIHAAERALAQGGKVVTFSDSDGFIHDKTGINTEKLEWLKQLKFVQRGRIQEYCKQFGGEFHAGKRPWSVPADIALPCATQNELDDNDARMLISNGCRYVAEGANMPSTAAAKDLFLQQRIAYMPGKAANAGGVAVSGLEMSQNSLRLSWSKEEVQQRLHNIMASIHESCRQHGSEDGYLNYVKGANLGAFSKIADSMLANGVI